MLLVPGISTSFPFLASAVALLAVCSLGVLFVWRPFWACLFLAVVCSLVNVWLTPYQENGGALHAFSLVGVRTSFCAGVLADSCHVTFVSVLSFAFELL